MLQIAILSAGERFCSPESKDLLFFRTGNTLPVNKQQVTRLPSG